MVKARLQMASIVSALRSTPVIEHSVYLGISLDQVGHVLQKSEVDAEGSC